MSEYIYGIKGVVNVPEEKKNEMNDLALEILFKSGMRLTKEIELAGKKHVVVMRPKPDENGIVCFDYNVFEKRTIPESTYDINTCILDAGDVGYNESGIAMNIIRALTESFSEGSCYFVSDGLPYDSIGIYLALIEELTSRRLLIPSREKLWDLVKFFRDDYEKVRSNLLSYIPHGFCRWYKIDLAPVILNIDSLFETDKEIPDKFSKEDFGTTDRKLGLYERAYLKKIMDNQYSVDPSGLDKYLKSLLNKKLKARKKMAEADDELSIIAAYSLYKHPLEIVKCYSLIRESDFWDEWDRLIKNEHNDHIDVMDSEEKHDIPQGLSRNIYSEVIWRESEDEFIEFKDSENISLSDKMKADLQSWNKSYHDIPDDMIPGADDVEKYLSDILSDLSDMWNVRLADITFIEFILSNRSDKNVRKYLVVLRKFMDKYAEYFPELTTSQANKWIVKRIRSKNELKSMGMFSCIVANEKLRKAYFK